MLPSVGALDRHWNRSCWVASVWRQATQNQIVYPPLDGNGWRQPDLNTVLVDWDSDDNIAKVRTAVAFIKKGCGCKTGCLTARCKCKKVAITVDLDANVLDVAIYQQIKGQH